MSRRKRKKEEEKEWKPWGLRAMERLKPFEPAVHVLITAIGSFMVLLVLAPLARIYFLGW